MAKKQLVAILTSVHPAYDVRIYHKQAISLRRAGFRVVLVAKAEDKARAETDGIELLALSPVKNRFSRMVISSLEMLKKALDLKADIYHFHDPELLLVGLYLKARGYTVIYDVHEDYPGQILDKHWIPDYLRRIVSRSVNFLEKRAAHLFDAVIAATPGIAKEFTDHGVQPTVVRNYPRLDEFMLGKQSLPTDKQDEQMNNKFVYMGSIAKLRGAVEMVEAINILPEHYKAELLLGGRMVPSGLREELEKKDHKKRMDYLGWLQRDEVINRYSHVLAGLALYQSSPNHEESQPNKIFEYMASGLPVIATAFPHWKTIIESCRCGIVVPPENPAAVAEAMTYLIENRNEASEMGKRGKEAVMKEYNWLTEEKVLLNIYNRKL